MTSQFQGPTRASNNYELFEKIRQGLRKDEKDSIDLRKSHLFQCRNKEDSSNKNQQDNISKIKNKLMDELVYWKWKCLSEDERLEMIELRGKQSGVRIMNSTHSQLEEKSFKYQIQLTQLDRLEQQNLILKNQLNCLRISDTEIELQKEIKILKKQKEVLIQDQERELEMKFKKQSLEIKKTFGWMDSKFLDLIQCDKYDILLFTTLMKDIHLNFKSIAIHLIEVIKINFELNNNTYNNKEKKILDEINKLNEIYLKNQRKLKEIKYKNQLKQKLLANFRNNNSSTTKDIN
ncbi:hypothetical protein K502DRAFT_333253 [Neoconidiobolus thromboides FSU 785]|nr:hypothetical protein K502DRAFT_333253 [Neoconidiobolus thromboides FSU 785]